MFSFLAYTVVILGVIVAGGFLNEKVTKLTYEIALMIFAIILGGIITVITVVDTGIRATDLLSEIVVFNLEEFLMKGVLCFMLFAGACHMRLADFKRLARPIAVLSVICTLLGALFYGFLFYGASCLTGLGFTLPMCLMFGSIVAPTDPIAATGILKKFGLPKDTGFLIEGESLLNDGVGVALFVCFSGLVTQSGEGGFFSVMFRQIFGAVAIGMTVMILLFFVFKNTMDNNRRIFVSLLAVSLSYWLCELFSCSGAIASVVCGVIFAGLRHLREERTGKMELEEFDSFWDTVDNLLNSVLYVILGFSFIRILQMPSVLMLSVIAVLCNLTARFSSVFISTFLMGKIPDGFKRLGFSGLLTWGGLRGGLSIALAMSTAAMLSDESHNIVLGCTYAIVFFTTVVQGLSMKKVYGYIRGGQNEGKES